MLSNLVTYSDCSVVASKGNICLVTWLLTQIAVLVASKGNICLVTWLLTQIAVLVASKGNICLVTWLLTQIAVLVASMGNNLSPQDTHIHSYPHCCSVLYVKL